MALQPVAALLAAGTPSPTPSPSPSGAGRLAEILQGQAQSPTTGDCWIDSPQSLCARVHDVTHSAWLSESADWLIAKPVTILVILLLAVLLRAILHRIIARLAYGASQGMVTGVLHRTKATSLLDTSPLTSERRKQRADTMASVLKSITTGVVFSIATLMILAEVGLNIAPLLASAGILGVALGFGAQTLVKDFLSGMFMILEDQYGVGDVVDVGPASGTVEAVGLRVTRVRSVDGTVWYVRNGEILRVGNMSQGWARAVLDVQVALGSDVDKVKRVLDDAAGQLFADPSFSELILERPEVWGVESVSAEALVIRLVIKTVPLKQWEVAREMRKRITKAFHASGIEMPFAKRAIWMRAEGPGHDSGAPKSSGADPAKGDEAESAEANE